MWHNESVGHNWSFLILCHRSEEGSRLCTSWTCCKSLSPLSTCCEMYYVKAREEEGEKEQCYLSLRVSVLPLSALRLALPRERKRHVASLCTSQRCISLLFVKRTPITLVFLFVLLKCKYFILSCSNIRIFSSLHADLTGFFSERFLFQ